MTKEDLKELKQRENNGDVSNLMTNEEGKVRILRNCINYLKVKGNFPSEARELRYNTIALDYQKDFICNPTSTRLLESTRCITSNPPPGLAGSSESSSHQLTPVESFKRRIKWHSSKFTNLKQGKNWDARQRNTLVTTRAQEVDKVLDSEQKPLAQEKMNLFSDKQTFLHSVLSHTLQTYRSENFVRQHEEDFDT